MAVEEIQPEEGPGKGWTWVTPPGAPAPSSTALPVITARTDAQGNRIPAAGRGSQIDPEKSARGAELAVTPLARPTGIDAIDSLTSPVGIASLAAGGVGVARAGITGGAAAGAKEAGGMLAGQVTAQAKYWLTKTALEKIGVPTPLAEGAAVYVSGRGAKSSAAGEAAPAAAAPRPMPAEAVPPTMGEAASAPMAAPVAAAPTNALPDQKALNEAASAARRAAYQAKIAAPASAQEAWTPAKLQLTAPEAKAAQVMLRAGKTDDEVRAAIEAQREFVKRFGTPQPTAEQLRFAKLSTPAPLP